MLKINVLVYHRSKKQKKNEIEKEIIYLNYPTTCKLTFPVAKLTQLDHFIL